MAKKFNQTYTLARVSGDAYDVVGKNGKTYKLVPVILLNGWHVNAFCKVAPEVDSLMLVRVVLQETGVAYTLFAPGEKVIEFVKRAYDDIQK